MNRRGFLGLALTTGAFSGAGFTRFSHAIETIAIGGVQLRSVSDGYIELPVRQVLPDQYEQSAAMLSADQTVPETIKAPCNLTLMQDGQNTVLFDVGGGPNFLETTGQLESAFAELETDPADVTHVVLTHAHPDHLWGLLDDFDELLFPNADYLISQDEWDFWIDPDTINKMPADRQSFAVGARRLLSVLEDQINLFKPGQEIVSGVQSIDTSGHTPGHTSFEIRNGSESVFVLGDALTNGKVSFEAPEWRNGADQDSALAVKARYRLLDILTSQKSAFIGYHLHGNGMGRAERNDGAFRFLPL